MADNVDAKHPMYEHLEYQFRQLRDTAAGTSNVKRSGDLYLPIPSAMLHAKTVASISNDDGQWNQNFGKDNSLKSNAPWYHANAAYSAYLQRARFPDIVSLCLRGFIGIAGKQGPVIKLPSSIANLEEKATRCGLKLEQLFLKCVAEVLLTGRYEILIDVEDNGDIIFVTYNAESFINWKEETVDGDTVPVLSVFKGCTSKDDDEFSHETVDTHLVLRLDENGLYQSQIYVDGKGGEIIEPSVRGIRLPFVPVVCFNSNNIGLDVGPSPMLGISDIALSIYQKDADMSQSEFMSCNPMLVLTGVDEDDAPSIIGSTVSYAIPNDQANAFYVEAKATSLTHMENRIKGLMEEAASYGVAILGKTTNTAEAAETVRMKQEASGATLKTVVEMVADGLEKALKIAAFWAGGQTDSIEFEPNVEFSEMSLSAQEQQALLQSWLNGGISYETYFDNMQKAGVIDENTTVEQEQSMIETSNPNLMTDSNKGTEEEREERQRREDEMNNGN